MKPTVFLCALLLLFAVARASCLVSGSTQRLPLATAVSAPLTAFDTVTFAAAVSPAVDLFTTRPGALLILR